MEELRSRLDAAVVRLVSDLVADSLDAAKTDVAGTGVERLWLAGCGPVAEAVLKSAEVRPAFDDFPRDLGRGLRWVVALFSG